MRTCPRCSSSDLDRVERLGGDATILKCLTCGNQWQHGIPPEPAEAGLTQEQRLRAKFPTATDIDPSRWATLRSLAAEHGFAPDPDEEAFKQHYQGVFQPESLSVMTLQDFMKFCGERGGGEGGFANIGPAQWAVEASLAEMGEEAFLNGVREAIEYLLYNDRRPLEQRFTDLVDGKRSPAMSGIREAVLTKVLVAAMPDQFFPLLVFDSPDGSGKRQIALAILGLTLPARDRAGWTIGRLAIWSNDLFVDVGRGLGFENLQAAGHFIWSRWNEHRRTEMNG